MSDGSQYWYIAWEDKKPILELDCEWEDVEYRMHTLNLLKSYVRQLEPVLKELQHWLYDKPADQVRCSPPNASPTQAS